MMQHHLWSGLGLVAPLEAWLLGPMPAAVSGVSIDTRTLQPGDLFFAIAGDASDGHDHVRAAFEKGAAAAVVSEARAPTLRGAGPLFIVHDVLKSMVALGRAARARSQARVIAVTGSVGKTSTKEALRTVLSGFGRTHASAASYNNHWGVPLTLARMPREALYGVFEIGMNHAGEITPLVAQVRPHVAIVTTVAPVHLEHFESVDAIGEAKAEIFSGLMPEGTAIIHRDVPQYALLRARAEAAGARTLTFGDHEDADARLVSIDLREDNSLVAASVFGEAIVFKVGAPGRHMAVNALAVLLAAHAAGCDVQAAAQALADVRPAPGRGTRATLDVAGGSFTLIDESYNANPASMRAALSLLAATQPGPGGRRIAVLGDMLELGPEGAALHAGLAPALEAAHVDLAFTAGPLMRHLDAALPQAMRAASAASAAEIEDAALAAIRPGDVVMVKGSNGSKTGRVVEAMKSRFARVREAASA